MVRQRITLPNKGERTQKSEEEDGKRCRDRSHLEGERGAKEDSCTVRKTPGWKWSVIQFPLKSPTFSKAICNSFSVVGILEI